MISKTGHQTAGLPPLTIPFLVLILLLVFPIASHGAEPIPCSPEPTDMTIQYGNFLSGENCLISPSGDTDLFRFTGSENQIVSLRATDQSGSNSPSICITLFGPDGVPTPAGGEICQNTNAEINEILEASGLHAIRIREADDDTMNYGLAVELLAPPPSPDADLLCFGCDIDAAIDASGDVDVFVFNAQVGDVVLARATDQSGSNSPSICISLFGPDGLPTVNGSTECQNTNAEITETIQVDGLHTIVAREADDDTMGYKISLERLAPPSPGAIPICFGCTINDSIGGGGDMDLYVFFGTPGDVVIIQATDQSGSNSPAICITLFGPDGITTPNGGTVCQNTTAEISETIASVGYYAILVKEADDDTMSYSVNMQCLAGICLNVVIFSDGFESGDLSNWS